MKSKPAVPGGSLASKPTWTNTLRCLSTSAFFVVRSANRPQSTGTNAMHQPNVTTAHVLLVFVTALTRSSKQGASIWLTAATRSEGGFAKTECGRCRLAVELAA